MLAQDFNLIFAWIGMCNVHVPKTDCNQKILSVTSNGFGFFPLGKPKKEFEISLGS